MRLIYDDTNLRIEFEASNVGSTPAYVIEVLNSATVGPKEWKQPNYVHADDLELTPEAAVHFPIMPGQGSNNVVDRPWNDGEWARWKTTADVLIIVSVVRYKDIFDELHETRHSVFCEQPTADAVMVAIHAEGYNHAS